MKFKNAGGGGGGGPVLEPWGGKPDDVIFIFGKGPKPL
jgi:hypothetical protein